MKNSKGFILAETIAVSTIVLGALIVIYSQFVSIRNGYYRSFKYNTVDDLYAVNRLVEYIETDGLDELISELEVIDEPYIDITTCPNKYFIEYMYCETMMDTLNIKTALFLKEDPKELVEFLNNNIFSENMYSFIKSIKTDDSQNYRVIVEFNDDTFATLKLEG